MPSKFKSILLNFVLYKKSLKSAITTIVKHKIMTISAWISNNVIDVDVL